MAILDFLNLRKTHAPSNQQKRVRRRVGSGRLATWYSRLTAFNIENLFAKSKELAPPRTVFVNQDLPQDRFNAKGHIKKEYFYASNQIITSKYTVVTFLPRNLLEQFRRVAYMCVKSWSYASYCIANSA